MSGLGCGVWDGISVRFRCTVELVTSGRTDGGTAPLLFSRQQEKMARFLALFLTAVYKQLYRDMGADMRSADTRVHALSAVCRYPTDVRVFTMREAAQKITGP